MKNLLLIPLFALLSAASLSAQSSVWKVTSGGNTIYLGGTCHMLRQSDFPLPPEFASAYDASEALFFETDLAGIREPAMQQMILSRGTYGTAGSLQEELSPEAWAAVETYCASSGLPVAMMNRFRPWMFAVTVAAIELQKLGATDEGVDAHFHRRATNDRKATAGLETIEQHVEFLVNMGAGHEDEMVIHSVNEVAGIPRMFDDVIAAWRGGDLESIDELLSAQIRRDYPGVHEDLIVKRNQAWLPQIETMLESKPVEFVLVGVAHLSGEDGLLAELQARGCAIEQARAAP